jgi:PAS domain S-box-containing protein
MGRNVPKFDRTKLSERENEILDLAIDGLTDAQMAQQLGIALSTVGSYWGRIRGKLGFFSRTEFVSIALREKAKGEMERVVERNHNFERQLSAQRLAGPELVKSDLYRAALEAVPDPLFVSSRAGEILFANDRLDSMFGYDRGELVGLTLDDLLFSRRGPQMCEFLRTAIEGNHSLRLGINDVLYGRRKNGQEMRVIILVDFRVSELTTAFCGLVRNFVDEVDARRKFAASHAHLV